MNIQVAVLCDAATEDNGKLNLLGAFDTIFAPQLPAVHPQCAVALRVTFMSGDEGDHKLKLNFVNADGKSIMPPIEIPVAVSLPTRMRRGPGTARTGRSSLRRRAHHPARTPRWHMTRRPGASC